MEMVTLEDELVVEVLHEAQTCELRVRKQRIETANGHPPLAIERTTLPGGPTRGPVLLVHGFAQNRYTWRISECSMSGWLASQGFDVLNVELRGHGNSRAYGAGNASDFAEYVADAVRVVDTLDQAPFYIGHSLGGAVGIGVATQRPLRGLVHLAGVYRFARFNRTLQRLARVSRRLEPALLRTSARIKTAWAGRLLGRLYRVTDVAGYTMPLAGWAPGSMDRHLLEERLEKGFDWTSVEVWMQMAQWARGEAFPYAEAFEALDLPLMVMAGDRDPLVPHEDAKACFDASTSSDKELVLLEPFDYEVHWGHIDVILGRRAPHVVWPIIGDWMQQRCKEAT
ncbi:MAG: alpha/beta hydrolase [Myxococcota bacterium]